MSKKCLMVLSPDDWRQAAPIVLLPEGARLDVDAAGLAGATIIHVDADGYKIPAHEGDGETAVASHQWSSRGNWLLKLAETPEQIEQTIFDQTDWAAPEIRVYYAGETNPSLCCRLPGGVDAELVVGRSKRRSHLPLEDEHISRRHARFFVQDGKQMVEDLGSRGGTFVNGTRIEEAQLLLHEDKIRVGSTTLEFVSYLGILEQFEKIAEPGLEEEEPENFPPDTQEEKGDKRTTGGSPRPLWDTVMYAMAIVTILVATILVITEFFGDG